MRRVTYISGTRADYGLMRNTLQAITGDKRLSLEVVACGMHLMPEFGKTIRQIQKDGFPVHEIEATIRSDSKDATATFLGNVVRKLTRYVREKKPDALLVLGDRSEMLAGAIVGAYTSTPVFHVHGGEVSSTVDEMVRHAITKLSHVHLAATKSSARRIALMGEDEWRIHNVGAPGLESIMKDKEELPTPHAIAKKYGLNVAVPLVLVLQHPVTQSSHKAQAQMKETMEAIKSFGHQTVVIYPNADAGGRAMIGVIESYRKYSFIRIYKSIPHMAFLALMSFASVMVGNSSSALIEAPSFRLPAINIGKRQDRRERGQNVIDVVKYDRKDILRAIKQAISDKEFLSHVKEGINPYYKKNTARRIVKVLRDTPIDRKLLVKQITY